MFDEFEKLLKTHDEIKNDIISDFANGFFNEVQKLVEQYGKEEFMKLLECNQQSA